MNRQFFISLAIFACLVVATVLVVLYGKGYRFGFGPGRLELKGTGILVTKSIPDGASVFVNGKLETATDNTINLPPGSYKVSISKEGYFAWEKQIIIQAETVSRAEALLIPSAPKLESITDVGAMDPVVDPALTKIAFKVSSQSAKRNGVYIYDMSQHPILLQSSASQIIDDSSDLFSSAALSWSPDGKDLMATVSALPLQNVYLLDTDQPNTPPNNISLTLPTVEASWNRMRINKERSIRDSLPAKLRPLVSQDFKVLSYSPDENKILYEASRSASLPVLIKPRLIGTNSTSEQRNLEKGKIYVYDLKEDRNYKMDEGNFKGTYSWFTDNRHLIFVRDHELHIMEYDGLNDTTVYAGPFIDSYAFPWPDATKIVILTNLGNSKILPNLYTISLK